MSRGTLTTSVHAIIAATAVVALTGCGLLGGGPEKDARYGSVVEFRDALVTAGLDCADWKQDDQISAAAQSGTCGSSAVLMTFTSQQDRDSIVTGQREFVAGTGIDVHLLVGPNWILNSAKAPDLQPAMGGSLVTK